MHLMAEAVRSYIDKYLGCYTLMQNKLCLGVKGPLITQKLLDFDLEAQTVELILNVD